MKIEQQRQQIYDSMIAYRQDPIGFMTNILSLNPDYIWSKMVVMAEGIRDHQLVAIRAGHSVSKTFTMGRVVPWLKICFQPSTIITTAPGDKLVKNQLWREIHAAYAGSKVPLGGKMHTLNWDVKPSPEILNQLSPEQKELWEKNFAIGFSTSPDTATDHATKMHGWHNEWVFVIADEACGIMPQIWNTIMEALIIDEQCKFIAIGNPTDPESDFARVCYSSDPEKNEGSEPYISDEGWYVITVAATDTPNYIEGRRVVPGLAGREFVERIMKKYGEDGDGTRYRVKGLFPKYKEGTYYGAALAKAIKEKRVGIYPWDPNAKVSTFSDTGDVWTAVIFAQFIRNSIRVIDDYWDNEGQGLPSWAKALKSKPYIYGGHFVGPELASGSPGKFQTGKTTIDLAAGLGYHLVPIAKHDFNNGIEAVRSIWSQIEINKSSCSTFIKASRGYGKDKNQSKSTDEETVYHNSPAQTWHRHMMDALRHLAMQYRYGIIDGERIGFPHAIPVSRGIGDLRYGGNDDEGIDPLRS